MAQAHYTFNHFDTQRLTEELSVFFFELQSETTGQPANFFYIH